MKTEKETKKEIQSWMYDVLRHPIITEKTTRSAEHNQFVFKVDPQVTKQVVKVAVEALYDVKVKGVNIVNLQGKTKRFRGRTGTRSDIKKAYVRLEKGETIELAKA